MFNKLLPREEQYFTLFAQMTSYINDAAKTLVEMLSQRDGDYQEYVQRIKSIEHACDDLTHSVATRLNQSFITPFDREDIYMMSKALDDVVDLIDGAARAVVMYDIHETTEAAKQLAGIIQRMAVQLNEIVSVLQKPKGVTERLVELHRLENEGGRCRAGARNPDKLQGQSDPAGRRQVGHHRPKNCRHDDEQWNRFRLSSSVRCLARRPGDCEF